MKFKVHVYYFQLGKQGSYEVNKKKIKFIRPNASGMITLKLSADEMMEKPLLSLIGENEKYKSLQGDDSKEELFISKIEIDCLP